MSKAVVLTLFFIAITNSRTRLIEDWEFKRGIVVNNYIIWRIKLIQNTFLFLVILSNLTVWLSAIFSSSVGVNWWTSSGVRVTSRSAISILDLAVLCSVVMRLVSLIQSMKDSRRISNLFHFIQGCESLNSVNILLSLCLNWFRVRANSMEYWVSIF